MAQPILANGTLTDMVEKIMWNLNVDRDLNIGRDLECSHDYNRMPYYENDDPVKKYWEGYSPFAESKDAQRYLEKHSKDKKPFLLFVSFATPHFPHNSAPQVYKDMYPLSGLQLNPNVPDSLKDNCINRITGLLCPLYGNRPGYRGFNQQDKGSGTYQKIQL